jgi:hypothetical protein
MKNKCNICYKIFGRIYELERHKNRKIKCISKHIDHNTSSSHCEEEGQNINIISSQCEEKIAKMKDIKINELKCNNCNKIFTRADNLKRHDLKYCNIKNIQVAMQTIIKEECKETNRKIEELQNTIIDLQSKINNETINTINNCNNNVINSNNNIVNNNLILKFDSPISNDVFTDKELINMLNKHLALIVPNMIEKLHFDRTKPEFHNVYLNDRRSKIAIIFDGEKYISTFLDDTICTLDSKVKDHLGNFVSRIKNSNENNIPNKDIQQISKRIEKLSDLEQTDIAQKRSNQYLKFILFDNREIVKETKKKFELNEKNKKLRNKE